MRAVTVQLLLATLLLCAGAAAVADIYKWLDEQGKVHYGDRPPAAPGDSQAVEITPPTPVSADQAERAHARRRLLEAYEADRADELREQAEADAAREEMARKCERARRDLAAVGRANVVYTQGKDGERIYMSDRDREQAVATAEAWMRKWCR
jgi:hypothetical protein